MLSRLRANGWTVTPVFYRRVAYVTLASLVLIVFTGAGVRLTGSGLGCPDWPKCTGSAVAPLNTHALIEYGNRLLSGLVSIAAIASGVLAWRRRPFRKELAIFGALLPIGVLMQAVLGGLTVLYDLKPGFVMSHYVLSMMLLDAAFALAWCARYESGERRKSMDALGVWAVRALLPLGSLTILVGTAATASGPHAGAAGTGEVINRLDFKGTGTLDWVIQRHGALAIALGLGTLAVYALLMRPGGDRRALPQLRVVLGLLVAQGVVGIVQYNNALPAELVWVHVVLAVFTWLSLLWSVAVAGRIDPERSTARIEDRPDDLAVAGRALAGR